MSQLTQSDPSRGLPSPASLCSEFGEQTPFYFSSPRQTLLVRNEHVAGHLECRADHDLPLRVAASLRDLAAESDLQPWVVGALPFDAQTAPASLWLLRTLQRADGRSNGRLVPCPRGVMATTPGYRVDLRPTPSAYVTSVEQALARIQNGELAKVVLARSLELTLEEPLSRVNLLRQLATQNLHGFTFALSLDDPRSSDPRTLLGVSPELLLAKRDGRVYTTPLAGSRPRGVGREEDERMARTLLASKKDLHEHALVVEAVVEALRPWCVSIDVPTGPSLTSTPTMWHLSTALSGELRNPRCSSLALAQALHPTPAVCGFPERAALQAIRELEGFERGLFAGAVGYSDHNGDGEWAVTLRCAELRGTSLRLFAGAGVVDGSEPWAEFDETAAKFGTVLCALGIGQSRGAPC